jgi:hypothetical protein
MYYNGLYEKEEEKSLIDLINEAKDRMGGARYIADWVQKPSGEVYPDDGATSQATTKFGETYLGGEGYGINEANGLMTHYLPDGTTREYAQSLPEVSIVGSSQTTSQARKNGFSVSLSGAFYMIMGVSFDIGVVKDGTGKTSMFCTFGFGTGLELGAGISVATIPAGTSLQQFADLGGFGSINGSLLFGSVNFNAGSETFGLGLSYGVGAKLGFSVRANRTVLLNPISGAEKADYYSRFGHIKR